MPELQDKLMENGSPSRSRVLGVIPARLASQRLPRKVLRSVAGKPLLAWVYEAAAACPQLDRLMIAVDSMEVAQLCEENGWPYLMTSPDLPSGTDRLAAIAQELPADIYVNIQGDEPLIQEAHVRALLAPFSRVEVDAATLKTRCASYELANPNAVKVVTTESGRALYFSRAPIPFDRDGTAQAVHWKHLGLYAYRRECLFRFAELPPSPLERTERLEQLRLLENGLTIYVEPVTEATLGVDTEEDLARVEVLLRKRSI